MSCFRLISTILRGTIKNVLEREREWNKSVIRKKTSIGNRGLGRIARIESGYPPSQK